MSFSFLAAGRFVSNTGLEPGECSIDVRGHATFRAEDLAEVGIVGRVAVHVDPDGLRIGLRAPREGEMDGAMKVSIAKNGAGSTRRRISLRRAIEYVRLEPAAVKGRHQLIAKGTGPGGMLIISFADLGDAPRAKSSAATPKFGYTRGEDADENE